MKRLQPSGPDAQSQANGLYYIIRLSKCAFNEVCRANQIKCCNTLKCVIEVNFLSIYLSECVTYLSCTFHALIHVIWIILNVCAHFLHTGIKNVIFNCIKLCYDKFYSHFPFKTYLWIDFFISVIIFYRKNYGDQWKLITEILFR